MGCFVANINTNYINFTLHFAEPTHLNCLLCYCKQFISSKFTGLGSINLSSKLSQAENVDLVLLITGGTARWFPGADIDAGVTPPTRSWENLASPYIIPLTPSRARQAPPSRIWFIHFFPNLKQESIKTSYLYFKCFHNFSHCTQLRRASCWVSWLGEFMVLSRRNAASISSKWVAQMWGSWINYKLISDLKCAQSLFSISYAHQFCSLGINLHHRQ